MYIYIDIIKHLIFMELFCSKTFHQETEAPPPPAPTKPAAPKAAKAATPAPKAAPATSGGGAQRVVDGIFG